MAKNKGTEEAKREAADALKGFMATVRAYMEGGGNTRKLLKMMEEVVCFNTIITFPQRTVLAVRKGEIIGIEQDSVTVRLTDQNGISEEVQRPITILAESNIPLTPGRVFNWRLEELDPRLGGIIQETFEPIRISKPPPTEFWQVQLGPLIEIINPARNPDLFCRKQFI